MMEYEKDYSLLRPFDLEAAKRGEEFWAETVGDYLVSSLGRVKGPKGIMIPSETHKGYLRVCLSIDGKQVEAKVHRLVASAFIDNPDNLPQVNHIDGNKQNNRVLNLEWCDNKHNQLHYRRVLKGGVVPIVAANDNEVVLFDSGAAAQEAGHNRGEISRVINNPSRKHHGFNWYSKEVFDEKTGVLCWVEGKPVYKGDVLYYNENATSPGKQAGKAASFEDGKVYYERGSNEFDGGFDYLRFITWTQPNVKREGWINVYAGGVVSSLIYKSKNEADNGSSDNRVSCIRIEWEE